MSDLNKFVQAQKMFLSGSGVSSSASTVQVRNLVKPGTTTTITMTDFGDTGYLVFEPGTSREENASFTGITQNADGSATFTGVTRGLDFVAPYTTVSALKHPHAGGTQVVISNSAPFYNELSGKDNDETITGTWTFTNTAYPRIDDSATPPTDDDEFAPKKYVDDIAIAGAPDGTATVKGIYELATIAEASAQAAAGSGDTTAALTITTALTSNTSGAAQIIPVTDADGDIPVEFMELDAAWQFTSTVDIATATNFQLGSVAYTGTMGDLNEASTFFGSTDISAAEAETLTDGSLADSLHTHEIFEIILSDDIIASADTERTDGASETGWVKVKEFTIGYPGEYRFTWDLKISGGGATAEAQVYRDGSPVGTLKSTSNTSYQAQTDDVSGWSIGDKAQLYVRDQDSGENVYIQNFRLKGTLVPEITVDID